jgi:hypothetical protein
MTNLDESLRGLAPHPLRGRIRRGQIGVTGLKLPELEEQPVVLGIADQGRIEDIVTVVVEMELASQLLRPRPKVRSAHAGHYSLEL